MHQRPDFTARFKCVVWLIILSFVHGFPVVFCFLSRWIWKLFLYNVCVCCICCCIFRCFSVPGTAQHNVCTNIHALISSHFDFTVLTYSTHPEVTMNSPSFLQGIDAASTIPNYLWICMNYLDFNRKIWQNLIRNNQLPNAYETRVKPMKQCEFLLTTCPNFFRSSEYGVKKINLQHVNGVRWSSSNKWMGC